MKTLHFYRADENGVRRRWRMTLDDKMTVIDERQDEEGTADPRNDSLRKDLTARGIEFEEQGGKIIITRIPEAEKIAIETLVDPSKCWFPECREIMRAYAEEKAKLPKDCPSCQQGALIRKYRDILINAAKKSG